MGQAIGRAHEKLRSAVTGEFEPVAQMMSAVREQVEQALEDARSAFLTLFQGVTEGIELGDFIFGVLEQARAQVTAHRGCRHQRRDRRRFHHHDAPRWP